VKVTDRRPFDADGSRRDTSADSEPNGLPGESGAGGAEDPKFVRGPTEAGGEPELPDVDFATLVLSFRASALVGLGLVADPVSGERRVSLDGARQMIEFLSVLKEKTAGNLSEEERRLLEETLYELQLQFVSQKSRDTSR
jgi:hypothetical protein